MSDREHSPKLPVSPLWLGVLMGLIIVTMILPGGYDGWLYYFQAWREQTTAPAWVHLLLAPITLLPEYPAPWRWTVVVLITAIMVRLAVLLVGGRWLWAISSVPFLWTIWLGQIEFIALMGVMLGWLVVHYHLHPLWMGVALIALITKVQVGWGIAVLFIFWLLIERRWWDLLYTVATALIILLITLLIYPNWIPLWLDSLRQLSPSGRYFDSSIFPIGLLAWGIALMPIRASKLQRLRLVACATLLGSPYFANYHCMTVVAITPRPAYWFVSWLTVIPMLIADNQRLAWIIPLTILFGEAMVAWSQRHTIIDRVRARMLY
ncbi:MAG: hypothetical protein CUN52_06230 [Phototrophicales bacterium]|nr:MAG: hypothetical protein CUN52_06230 [Phototrophicales bacterium]